MSYELFDRVINEIDNGNINIKFFEEETLFMNIFYCYYFTKFLSPFLSWRDEMIKKLKRNIRRKWSKNLPNVDFFIRQIEKQTSEIDSHDYYFNSEDYFTKLLFLKPISDILFPIEKKKKKKKKKKEIKKYVLIRLFFYF